jgi:hypothetical protein
MKPYTKAPVKALPRTAHDITVKGTKHLTFAICYTESDGEFFAIGSRNHVNRQVRMHRSR